MEPTGDERWWEELTVIDMAPAPAASAPGDPEPPAIPMPGRHADRRSWLADLLPETLRGRVSVGPWHITVVALLVALALAATCWMVVRSDASVAPLAAPAAGQSSPSAAGASASPLVQLSGSPTAAAPGTVTVDVAGKVRQPGVLVLPAGSRVLDALDAAGGARNDVDLGALNQARVLVDGEQIVVGATAPPLVTPGVPGAPAAAEPGALVNLNTAGAEELDTLPEVGPVTAQSILDYRTEHGGFASVDELLDVDGIGETTLARIAPHVTV